MKSTFIFFSTALAYIIASAIASADTGTAYTLTSVIDQPDPSRSNRIRWIEMTDDYLAVAAPLAGFPADAGRVFLFDVTGERLLHTLEDPQFRGFPSATFGNYLAIDGKHVAVPDRSGEARVHIFDAESGLLRHSIESPIAGHLSFGSSGLAVGGDYVVIGAEAIGQGPFGPNYPGVVWVFDALSGELLHTLNRPEGIVRDPTWGAYVEISEGTIAIGSPRGDEARVLLYDAQTGEHIGTLEHPQNSEFDSLEMRPDRILLGQIRGHVDLLDTTGNLLQTFDSPGMDPQVSGAFFEFSGDNILIASFGSLMAGNTVEPEAWLYDATSGQLLQRFSDAEPADRFFSIDSNPSGSQIAILRAKAGNFATELLVYSRIPEPSSAILSGIAAGTAWLSCLRCTCLFRPQLLKNKVGEA